MTELPLIGFGQGRSARSGAGEQIQFVGHSVRDIRGELYCERFAIMAGYQHAISGVFEGLLDRGSYFQIESVV